MQNNKIYFQTDLQHEHQRQTATVTNALGVSNICGSRGLTKNKVSEGIAIGDCLKKGVFCEMLTNS